MLIPNRDSAKSRFLSHVAIAGDNECWIWKGANKGNGYGHVSFSGKNMTAHRLSYMLFIGEIPIKHDVCHKCDNRPCVNPSHLFVGTRKMNMEDAVKKNRQAKREMLPQTKMSDADRMLMMTMVNNNILYKEISKHFEVTPQLVGKIAIGMGVRRNAKQM